MSVLQINFNALSFQIYKVVSNNHMSAEIMKHYQCDNLVIDVMLLNTYKCSHINTEELIRFAYVHLFNSVLS